MDNLNSVNDKDSGISAAVRALADIFNAESSILVEIGEKQKQVESAVYEKKWLDFEKTQDEMHVLQQKLKSFEVERRVLFESGLLKTNGRTTENFYLWTEALRPQERKLILDSYRALKVEGAKIEAACSAFNGYINEMRTLISGILDAAFPERRGSIYGKSGKSRSASIKSILLDKQF